MNEAPVSLPVPVEIFRIQLLAIIGSFLFLIFILFLIRNKKIKEEYSLLWLLLALIFLGMSFWRESLDYLAYSIGVAYPPAALFLLSLAALFILSIQFSVIISRLSENNKLLAQELGILKIRLKQLISSTEVDKGKNKEEKAKPAEED